MSSFWRQRRSYSQGGGRQDREKTNTETEMDEYIHIFKLSVSKCYWKEFVKNSQDSALNRQTGKWVFARHFRYFIIFTCHPTYFVYLQLETTILCVPGLNSVVISLLWIIKLHIGFQHAKIYILKTHALFYTCRMKFNVLVVKSSNTTCCWILVCLPIS